MNKTQNFKEKMRLAISATAAIWMAEIVLLEDGWSARSVWGDVTETDFDTLLNYTIFSDLVSDVLQSGKIRTRQTTGQVAAVLGGRLTVFPTQIADHVLVVGTDKSPLEHVDRSLLHALSLNMVEIPSDGDIKNNAFKDDPKREAFMRVAKQIVGLDIADLDFESVLRESVQRSREIVGGTGAELGLVDFGNGVVRVLWSTVSGEKGGQYLVPIGEDVVGQVARSGMPLWINDYQSWPGRKEDNAPYEAIVGVPLRFKGEVIGTLSVVDSKPNRQFTDEDAYLLEVLAAQIAISIRNARLFQELGERIRTQRAAEAKMIEATRLAAIGEMAASVAHELNNPLTAICGFSELLLEEFPEESGEREYMGLVLSEARRARDVVRRLLDFSRRESSVRTGVNVNEEISQVLQLVQPMALIHNVTIQSDTWEDLPPIFCERNQLRQVLLNLVANGIQSMPNGGNLQVQTALDEGSSEMVAIRIIDQGVGIPDKYLKQIFDPFFTTKPVGSGTGLGLSISNNIIIDHGGDIQVDSVEGEGTCFTIKLPIYDETIEG